MSNIITEYFESAHSSLLSETDLLNCLRGLPALLFRIELAKNRVEYLNDFQLETLGEKTFLLLKNPHFSQEIIFEEDYPIYEAYIRSVHGADNSSAVFRVNNPDGTFSWLKLFGSPNAFDPGFYLGMLVDITPDMTMIEQMKEREAEQQTMLDMLDNPVVLVDITDKNIISHNSAAHELFGYSIDEFRKLKLSDLYHHGFKSEMIKIFEDIIFDKKWEGKILFRRKNQSRFWGKATLRSLKIKEKRLLRISVYGVDSADISRQASGNRTVVTDLPDSKKQYVKMLLSKVEPISDIKNSLELFLKNPFDSEEFDGIIYSDILVKKGQVIVYGVGAPFKNLSFGLSFSYEGTIAENIEQYKLDHLIVDDTMSSIKAIDWALFIPYGIRSYFAKPFYERNVLRSVLILCSKKPNVFSEDKLDDYALLDEPFIKGLKSWRKAARVKKIKE